MAKLCWRRYTPLILLTIYTVLWVVSIFRLQSVGEPIQDSRRQVEHVDYASQENAATATGETPYDKLCDTQQPSKQSLGARSHIDCKAVIRGDAREQSKASKIGLGKTQTSDGFIAKYASNCDKLLPAYRTCPTSEEERQYPIAFSILCHTNAAQVERLLRNIYQPQNVYCIHPDSKSKPEFLKAMQNIANCFHNVFIASKLERVVYASYSRLQAEINCMADLVSRPERWAYLINLVGQAFPLKTNLELVNILKIYNGANDIEGLAANKFMQDRVSFEYTVRNRRTDTLVRGRSRSRPVPGNLTLIRGSAYGVFSRAFLEFVFRDELARELLEWSNDTRTPDEHYWATLNQLYHNPTLKSPGGFKGRPENNTWLASYSKWQVDHNCRGKIVRFVCVFGVKDLTDLVNRHELFANKFYQDYQPLALDCMEEWITNRTYDRPHFNFTYYKSLPFVRGVT